MRLMPRAAHIRLFRVMLLAYPGRFRREFGGAMTALFESRLDRRLAGGRPVELIALWMNVLRDTAMSAAAERWSGLRNGSVLEPTDERRRESMLDALGQDIAVTLRRLAKAPAFALAAVAIVALGIGANTAAFTLVDALLFRPPPFADAERVVRIYQDSDDGDPSSSSYPATRDMAEFTDVFSGVAAWSPDALTWSAPEGPRPVAVEYVTSSYLPVLGLTPSVGRWFESAHDHPGAGAYAVLTWSAWRSKFGGDAGIIGETIQLNGQPVTVLGVGPKSFNGSGGALTSDMWLSISSTPLSGGYRVQNLDRREDHWYQVWARLAPGVSVARAQAAMNTLAARLAEQFPELDKGRDITVFHTTDIRMHPDFDGEIRAAGTILMLVVGMVLLLACSNLAGLVLIRGMSRSSEIAVRRALGASRARVARLLLAEPLLLAAAGGAVGLVLARWVVSILPSLPLALPIGGDLRLDIDARVLIFTVVLVVATGVLFGLYPALRTARSDLAGTLRQDVRFAAHGRRAPYFRNAMLIAQVAISLVLLVASGLLVRSLGRLQSADAGVDTEKVAYMAMNPNQAGLSGDDAAVAVDDLRRRVAGLAGVERVAIATRLPVENRGGTSTTIIDGYVPPSGTGSVELLFALVTPGYFETVGIQLRSGRVFTDADLQSDARGVVVNETAARRYWSEEDPIGRRIRPQGAPDSWSEVIGVVADSKSRTLDEPPTPMVYRPFGAVRGPAYLLVRAEGSAASILAGMRAAASEGSPPVPATALATLEDQIRAGLASPRMIAGAMGGFSLVAMLLTALGIHAVLSFGVARRSAELGIRMALGAAKRNVVVSVVGEVLVTVAIGLVAGLALAATFAPRIEGLLYDVSWRDPAAFGVAAALLVVVAAVAAFLPARRAVGIDPVESLRARP